MINDVSRAYVNANCTRCIYVEIPPEDPGAHPDFLGRLRLCLYGTRDAAIMWQQTLSELFVGCGFVRWLGHRSFFHHPKRDITTLVHGDDYCSAGMGDDLDWLHEPLEKRYDIKTQRIGDGITKKGVKKATEVQIFNRVVRRTSQGFELEADLRHAELIVEQLGLCDCKAVGTPGIPMIAVSAAEDEEPKEK